MPNTLVNVAPANWPPEISRQLNACFTQGMAQWLTMPIAYSTADAALLFTNSTGSRLYVHRVVWEVTTGFTGGTSSAIGVSSDATGYSTQGDLLGGASGDVAATLVAGITGGTLGAKFGSNGVVVIPNGKSLRFDRITSAFTAGAGFVHAHVSQLPAS